MTASDASPGTFAADARTLVRRTWWVFVFGGLASIAFGVLALVAPGIALFVLATYFAASVLVDGVSALYGAMQNRDKDGWAVMALMGALGILVAGYALFNPPLSIVAFVFVVAFQAIVVGILIVMLGYRVRRASSREWMLYLTGALSVLFGLLVLARPEAGGLSIVALIAGWSIVTGVLKFVFGMNLRTFPHRI
jgi:uncharacterized membrane protein HdeD (DUF308 family)